MSDPQPIEVQPNDVIQIAPGSQFKSIFYGKLAFVQEVRNWGVTAYIETFKGDVHLRLPWGSFERVGAAPFIPVSSPEEPEPS